MRLMYGILQYGDMVWAFHTKKAALRKLAQWESLGIASGAKIIVIGCLD